MNTHYPLSHPEAQETHQAQPVQWDHERERVNAKHGRSRAAALASIISGGALAVLGVTRRSLPGAALAAGGGFLIYHGLSGRKLLRPVHVLVSYSINQPVERVWQSWRNFSNLPRFMAHLESVQATSSRYSYWTARPPLGGRVSWHAEITEERENQYVAWRSGPGSDIENAGSVEFRRIPGDRGTEIRVAIDYRPPGGRAGDAVAALFGGSLQQQVREDVRRFKQWLEAGEIPSTEGQPHGRRSLRAKAVQEVWPEPRPQVVSMRRTA